DSLGNWGCTPMVVFLITSNTVGGGGSTPTPTPCATPTSTTAPTSAPTGMPTYRPTAAPTGAATATPEVPGEQPTAAPTAAVVSETRARAGVSAAQEAIALAKTQGVNAPEAERLLALAQQALNNGQYALALENAQLAQNALQQAQAAGGAAAGGIDLTLVGVIIIVVLAGAAYLYSTRKKRKGM
ncbi:MAG: hypothetical protein V1817_02590, partial [Candidatus Micrarchaeota archaeon]